MVDKPAQSSLDRFPLYTAGAFSGLLVLLQLSNAFFAVDNKWTDQLFRWRGVEQGDPRVIVVALDDESIKAVGQFPWPRSAYARLLDRLFAYGSSVIGMDVLFPDPSYPKEDEALVRAVRKWGERVVLSADKDPASQHKVVIRFPFPAMRKAARSIGSVSQFLLDSDGMVRRSLLMVGGVPGAYSDWPRDPERVPALGLKVLSVYEKKRPDDYLRDRGFRNDIFINLRGETARKMGELRDKDGNQVPILIPLPGIRRLSAWRVLKGELDEDVRRALKGAIILVGSTSIGYFDHFPSPFVEQAPGVEVHANLIDNLLNRRELRPVAWWTTCLLVLFFSLLSAFVLAFSPLAAAAAVAAGFLAWIAVNYLLFLRLVVLDFAAPSLAIAGPFAVLLLRKTLSEAREKRFIKQTFGQFVAPEVVDDLVKDPRRVKLGGEKRDMTVFFLDIAHFTTISEKMAPEALILFLNRYLSALSHVIHDQKGVVDKYIGDCIMAFWNAPIEQKDHRAQACVAAVECQEVMDKLNLAADHGLPELPAIRIGLNSGDMTVGLTGSEKKLQYTVIGDEVNLASRLEGANKFFGSKIMASESCYAGARDAVEARELGRVRVVGKAVPIRVYELLARKGRLSDAWKKALPAYRRGVELFNSRDFAGAKAAFSETLAVIPQDPPAKLYLNVCEDYAAIPPAPDWDGVFNLTAK